VAFAILEALMDTAAAQACRCRNVPHGQPCMLGGNKSPDAFALGFLEARGGQLEPGFPCSFMVDTLMDVFTDFSHGQTIPVCHAGVEQIGSVSVYVCTETLCKLTRESPRCHSPALPPAGSRCAAPRWG